MEEPLIQAVVAWIAQAEAAGEADAAADQVLVLVESEIVERGRNEELA